MNSDLSENISEQLAGEYLCLLVNGEEYGLPAVNVREVIFSPVIRKVPRAPSFIEGVANIGGRIVPILNLSTRLNLPGSIGKGGKVVLAELNGSPYGFLGERVTSISHLNGNQIEPINPILEETRSPFILGMAKRNDEIIHLLDLEALVTAGVQIDERRRIIYEAFSRSLKKISDGKIKTERDRLLVFSTGFEEYAIEVRSLVKVIKADEMIPADDELGHLVGTIRSDGELLPVIDVRAKLSLPSTPHDSPRSRVIIVDAEEYRYGIIAESISGLIEIERDEIKEVPRFLVSEEAKHARGIAILDSASRFVLILDKNGLIGHEEVGKPTDMVGVPQPNDREKREGKTGRKGFVVFEVAGREYAVETKLVTEVMTYHQPTPVPKSPSFIAGLLSVKGELAVAIDLRKRLNLAEIDVRANRRMIVGNPNGSLCALIVDRITGVISVEENFVRPVPEEVTGADSTFADGIISLPEKDRTVTILNIARLIGEDEICLGK